MAHNIVISPVTSTGGYRVEGMVNGAKTSFLVDTGAAVSLLRKDAWARSNADRAHTGTLEPWSKPRLVGVDGSPLPVLGCTQVEIDLAGEKLPTEVVVVSALTTEAILGLDFLHKYRAKVDLGEKQLFLGDRGCTIPLLETNRQNTNAEHRVRVRALETIKLPPSSEMEVMAYLEEPPGEGTWLVEGTPEERAPALVARALVNANTTRVPVRLLNPRTEPVHVYKGVEIAVLEQVDVPSETGNTVIANVVPDTISQEKQEMLWGLVETHGAELDAKRREQFYELLLTYSDIFASSSDDLGRTAKLGHSIHTGDATPVRQPVRRIPPYRRQEVQTLLDEMLRKEVIQRSTSPWASPIVLVKKKDGTTRFCVDYRKLNDVTRKDAYPLPRIDATLDTLAGSKWFSTLDLLSGYWQVEMAESDRQKTAFCTTEGLFEFKVMPFGLCNAPATFQRLMDLVLAGLQWSHCLVYLDDVIVLGRTFEDHLHNLQAVFHRIRDAGLKLKPPKCAFFQPTVQYLGHIISEEGVAADPAKIEKVVSWPAPTSTREVQQFLGFASYYRRFIRDFARVAKPLHRLTERTRSFFWAADCQSAFEELRHSLSTAPVLAHPDFSRSFILDTDASNTGIGAVLSQIDDSGKERVVAYGSRVLSKPERRYCVTRRELLAVVYFTRQFRPYLAGRRFTLRTDHGSLTWLRNFKEPEGQLARWLERLQEFDFGIEHRRGRKHTNADALSRLPCRQCGRESHDTEQVVVAVTLMLPFDCSPQDLRATQLADATMGPVLKAKEAGQKPAPDQVKSLGPASRRLFQLWDQLLVKNGFLWRRYEGAEDQEVILQLVVPKARHAEVLKDLHEGVLAGHLGIEKMLARLKERFYWPGHFNDVQEWCKNCAVCTARKTPAPKARAPLQSIKTGYPLQIVATDILGPFPESPAGNNYILVVADYFTRWVEAYAIPNQEATTVAQKLTNEFFFRFSPPEQLHSDQGRQFQSQLIAEVCKLLGVRKSCTTPYHPQSDGMVERFNRTLLNMLATAATEHPFDWESHLRHLCMAYNTSVHPTTGYTPFYLMYGRQVRMPIDVMYGTPTPNPTSPSEYADDLRKKLENAYQKVREQMGHKLDRQKDLYDKRVHGKLFEAGDLVMLFSPVVPRGCPRKLHRPWTGPFKIVNRLSDVTYRIQDVHSRRHRLVVHFNRLKACPPNMRFPDNEQTSSPPQNRNLPPDPVGAQLELVDEIDYPSPPEPRYPRRHHTAPDYFQPVVSH